MKLGFMRRDMMFHQQFFLLFGSSGTCCWVQASRRYFRGSVLVRASFSCTFSIHRLETVLLNIVIDWPEQFWTRPCLQSFRYIRVMPAEKTHGSSQKRLYHFPQLAILGIQFITNMKPYLWPDATQQHITLLNHTYRTQLHVSSMCF
jgi:hypothetical protein